MQSESLFKSFQYAITGLMYVIRTQRNAQIHSFAFFVVLSMAIWLQVPPLHWAVLILTAGMVFFAEAANTAIETVVDLVSPEYHELAGRAKDVAAGGVLLTALLSVPIGLIVLGPALLAKLFG